MYDLYLVDMDTIDDMCDILSYLSGENKLLGTVYTEPRPSIQTRIDRGNLLYTKSELYELVTDIISCIGCPIEPTSLKYALHAIEGKYRA